MSTGLRIREIKPDEEPPKGGWPTTEHDPTEEEELPAGVVRFQSRRVKIVETTTPLPAPLIPTAPKEAHDEGVLKILPDPQVVMTAIAAMCLLLFLVALAVIFVLLF